MNNNPSEGETLPEFYDEVSDLLLQRSRGEDLHNGLGWLGFDLHLLAKHDPDSCFGSWLCSCLDSAQAWNGKHTSLLHLLCGNVDEAVEHLRTGFGLESVLRGNRLQQSAFAHCLCLCALFHRLHGRQHAV